MSRTYNRGPCDLCGKSISCAGLAKTAHMRKHVREGLAIEIVGLYWFGKRFEEVRTFSYTPGGVAAYRAEIKRRKDVIRARKAEERDD